MPRIGGDEGHPGFADDMVRVPLSYPTAHAAGPFPLPAIAVGEHYRCAALWTRRRRRLTPHHTRRTTTGIEIRLASLASNDGT
jgi:hypothetical protein